VYGSPATVREGLLELHERTQAQELMLTAVIHGFDARLSSCQLVAEAFGLVGAPVAG
jgi:alkanesulfonate monooxygenase SsuD/methylene tetrahydromethanopterin reductase-like flavin-dependent oxidoreductase (luciferase family)